MLVRIAAVAALIAAAGCAGVEPAGRNAQRAPAPPAVYSPAPQQRAAVTPPPAQQQPAPPTAAPPVAAPQVSAPPPPRRAAATDDNVVVVPGARDVQVPPPGGDPRSNEERIRDIRAWDQCVLEAQSIVERDPMGPPGDSPEELCRRELGMAERTAVPTNRRP